MYLHNSNFYVSFDLWKSKIVLKIGLQMVFNFLVNRGGVRIFDWWVRNFIEEGKLPKSYTKIALFKNQNNKSQLICQKIDGFKNSFLKIDGFGRNHQTHANYASALYT